MTVSEPLPNVRVWELNLDVPEDEVMACLRLLSTDERARAERYVFPAVRSRFIVGRGRLRTILGEMLDEPADKIRFVYGAHGKPSLQSPWDAAGYRFSLSHSADRALLAVTQGLEIGCDLESHRELRYGEAVAKRFFSEDENKELSRFDGDAWPRAFLQLWTLKEAFIKALGIGLSYPTRDFTVSLEDSLENRLIAVKREPDAQARWHLAPVGVATNFTAAVCLARA